ncbi:Cytochrome P450 4C1, partial [Zootermopsis nevadensis]
MKPFRRHTQKKAIANHFWIICQELRIFIMDIMTAMLSILLVLILFLVMRRDPEKSRIKKMLSKIPGPPTYPILGNAWELINLPSHRYMDVLSKYSNDYGPIFCTWIGTKGIVSLNTAETAE